MATKKVVCLGDPSSHGGSTITTNTDGTFKVGGVAVCASGCNHTCPQDGHGVTPVTAITTKSYVNGKLIVTEGASAGCGAVMTPPSRNVYVE